MKLYWSDRSPFVRKVMMTAHEAGLAGRIQTLPAVVTLRDRNPEVVSVNPLGQLPTLLTDDGEALFGSSVICAYLVDIGVDVGSAGRRLRPSDPARQWDARRREALADGVLDGLMRWYSERARADDPRSAQYVAVSQHKLLACADWLEARMPGHARPDAGLDVGDIAVGCALSYADFRFAELDWRTNHPALAAWHSGFTARPSYRATLFLGEGA